MFYVTILSSHYLYIFIYLFGGEDMSFVTYNTTSKTQKVETEDKLQKHKLQNIMSISNSEYNTPITSNKTIIKQKSTKKD